MIEFTYGKKVHEPPTLVIDGYTDTQKRYQGGENKCQAKRIRFFIVGIHKEKKIK